jgi:hypothetical protein
VVGGGGGEDGEDGEEAMSLPSATATSATVECKIMYLLRMSEQRYGTRKFIENILLK